MKAVILCDGFPPERKLLIEALEKADLFIAADGGGNRARELKISPDVVIGDLDTFQPKENDSFDIIQDPDQETNDLEKALSHALVKDITDIIVLGATGHRLDQTLKNLSVLKQFNSSFDQIYFKDNYGEIFLIPGEYSENLAVGTTISLFPLSGRVEGIQTKGLKYPLNNEALENGVRDGSSNEVISSPVTIRHISGDLLLYILQNESKK